MVNKKIEKLLHSNRLTEAQKLFIKDGYYIKYNRLFKNRVWSKLTFEAKKILFDKFFLFSQSKKYHFKELLQNFSHPVVPRAFVIAAIAHLDNEGQDIYEIVDNNPFVDEYHELIFYDIDHWGAQRGKNTKRLGMFDINSANVSYLKKEYLEYLLRCSLSLNKSEKIKIITRAPTLTKFQIEELIKTFEEELFTWYASNSRLQFTDIENLIQKASREWQEIINENSTFQLQKLSFDRESDYTPKSLAQLLGEHIVGQDEAVRSVAMLIYYHKKRAKALKMMKEPPITNRIEPVLLMGPTGCGKSFLIKKAAQLAELKFVHVDSSSLVSVGIKGYNTNDALKDLLRKSKYSKKEAECGIIYFDEIDKLLVHHDGLSILSQLLRITEGTEVQIEKNNTQEENEFKSIHSIDTTNILFIFGGSFHMAKEEKKIQGFASEKSSKKSQHYLGEKLEKYGIPRELIGRVEEVIKLNPLDKNSLKKILLESKSSPIKKFEQMLALNGQKATLSKEALEDIVERSQKSPYGARVLNALLKEHFYERLFFVEENV